MKLSGLRLMGPLDMSMFQLVRPCEDHVYTILRPCFGNFYNIFASRWLQWLKFSLESQVIQIEENHSIWNYCDHIRAMFRPCFGHIRAIFRLFLQYLLLDAWNGSNFYWIVMHAKWKNTLECLIIGTILGQCLGHNG